MNPLDGAVAKLDWANHHLDQLYEGIGAFFDKEPYDIFFHTDNNGWRGGRLWIKERPPDELGLILGDAIHNVRGALDHAIYAIGTEPNERSEFPIHSDERQYTGTDEAHPVSRRDLALAKVPREFHAVVDAAQPYRRGNKHAIREDPLAILAWLSNADKHRLVHPAFMRQWSRPQFVITNGRISDVQTRVVGGNTTIEERAEVFAWRPRATAKADVNVDVKTTFTVAFSERAIDYFLLVALCGYVRRILETLRVVADGGRAGFDNRWNPREGIPPGFRAPR
jgi:hypothetical protein